jgi:hypothetical protein
MSDHTAETAARSPVAEPATSLRTVPAALEVGPPASVAFGVERGIVAGESGLAHLRHRAPSQRQQALLGIQRAIGNHALQRLILAKPLVNQAPILRQAGGGQPPSISRSHTITDPQATVRGGPPDFKATKSNLPVGTRVDVTDEKDSAKRPKVTYVEVAEHGSGNALGWTAKTNLGDVKYAAAGASFVYVAKVQPREGHPDSLPVMVYVPPKFDGKKADVVLYFHGDAADYSATKSDNYDRENPAIGMKLAGMALGPNQIVIAPQGNEWTAGGTAIHNKSPWATLHAGDYERIVQTVFANLQDDLKFTAPIARGAVSIAGHSGGGKALGQAAQDLDSTGGGVKDVTLVDAGYGGREDAKGKGDGSFAKSFQMVREWLLKGSGDKVLRVITKATIAGSDTRRAIEKLKKGDDSWSIPVLGLDGVKNAIKASGREADLQADATEVAADPKTRTGGMQLVRKIVVSQKTGGKVQGTIFVFLMSNPPRGEKVDTHFGTRNATIGDIVAGQGKGDDFAVH